MLALGRRWPSHSHLATTLLAAATSAFGMLGEDAASIVEHGALHRAHAAASAVVAYGESLVVKHDRRTQNATSASTSSLVDLLTVARSTADELLHAADVGKLARMATNASRELVTARHAAIQNASHTLRHRAEAAARLAQGLESVLVTANAHGAASSEATASSLDVITLFGTQLHWHVIVSTTVLASAFFVVGFARRRCLATSRCAPRDCSSSCGTACRFRYPMLQEPLIG
eukprot:TRINITY_DN71025_c0_g1_i1.p1 TRINITY_DN71025_c0_g1~~TRINITY_DN71025_c0_g1_i1.p1  ORF type:complete len:231 (-),score=9.49 TRINITY_DN71025_c0_g1_i1:77-769(-)